MNFSNLHFDSLSLEGLICICKIILIKILSSCWFSIIDRVGTVLNCNLLAFDQVYVTFNKSQTQVQNVTDTAKFTFTTQMSYHKAICI